MKRKMKFSVALTITVTLCFVLLPAQHAARTAFIEGPQNSQDTESANYKQAIATFEGRVKEYAKLRDQLAGKLPKLPKKSKPAQIKAHKTAFEELVRSARADAKPGDLFTTEIADYIRLTIKNEFKGRERRELREEVLESETAGVPLRINYPYPETQELMQIPPTLLLKLPQLPKQVRYRFVKRHMLLVDRENGLIIDYMLNAIP